MTALIWLIIWLTIALVVFLATGKAVDHKSKPKRQLRATVIEPEPVQPEPIEIEAPADEGRGAHAILARAARARALAHPGQGAPKNTSYCVVRQQNRELAVVVRVRDEPATDQIIARFAAHEGMRAWDRRNQLQYG